MCKILLIYQITHVKNIKRAHFNTFLIFFYSLLDKNNDATKKFNLIATTKYILQYFAITNIFF